MNNKARNSEDFLKQQGPELVKREQRTVGPAEGQNSRITKEDRQRKSAWQWNRSMEEAGGVL